MKTLDRYLLLSFFGLFLGSMVAVTFLFTVVSVLDSLTYLMNQKSATFTAIIHYYSLQLPQTVYMTSPVSALLSAMITLGALNQRHELTAMRAAGIAMARAALPILAASLAISLALFALGNTLVPVGNGYFLSAKHEIKGEEADASGRTWYVSEGKDRPPTILRVESVDRDNGRLQGVSLFRVGPGFQLLEEMTGRSAEFIPGQGWRLAAVRELNFLPDAPPKVSETPERLVPLPDRPEDMIRVERAPEEMTLSELQDQIRRVRAYGLPVAAYEVERQTRFAIPLSALILVLVGAPLAVRPVRSSGLAWGILGAIIVGFGYFVIIAEFISLGRGGLISPPAAAWTANVIFGVLGAGLYSRLVK